ncbi:unnamed protein product, partial [Prorocentrum cordatum]
MADEAKDFDLHFLPLGALVALGLGVAGALAALATRGSVHFLLAAALTAELEDSARSRQALVELELWAIVALDGLAFVSILLARRGWNLPPPRCGPLRYLAAPGLLNAEWLLACTTFAVQVALLTVYACLLQLFRHLQPEFPGLDPQKFCQFDLGGDGPVVLFLFGCVATVISQGLMASSLAAEWERVSEELHHQEQDALHEADTVFELDQDLDEDLDLERARALSWAASRQRSRSATEELEADGGVEILEQADAFEVRRPQRPRSRAQVREPAAQTARRRPPRLTFLAELEGQFSQRDLVTSYGSLIETACRNGDTDVAEGWLREGAKIGFAPDAGTFEVFAKAAAVQGDLVACERWFDRTVEEGYAPGEAMYFSLVSAASRRGDLQSAERWFHRALEAGVRPGTLTLEALADAAGRKSAPSPKRKDIPRDVEIIEDADAFRRVRDSSGGQWQEQATPSWFADLQVQNTWSRATLISMYGILISNAGKNGNLIAAESWFRQGSSLGFQPTLKTFEALAEAAARSGSLSSAEEWIMEAIQAGF